MASWENFINRKMIDTTTGDIFVRTKSLRSWQEVKDLLNKFDHNWIFRGQEDSSWGLQTSLERWAEKEGYSDYEFFEKIFLEEFKRGAKRYLSSLIHLPENTLEWLSLMQHHGCPTRLLDFTKSPYVAAFFALEDCKENGCAIWCVESNWCKETAVKNFNKEHIKKEEQISIVCDFAEERIFKVLFWEDPKAVKMIFPVSPLYSNERIDMQQGLFLCQGSNETFEENVKAMDSFYDYIIKIIISPKVRKEAIIDLNKMNINNATLFPGLDGYARSIKNKVWIER